MNQCSFAKSAPQMIALIKARDDDDDDDDDDMAALLYSKTEIRDLIGYSEFRSKLCIDLPKAVCIDLKFSNR